MRKDWVGLLAAFAAIGVGQFVAEGQESAAVVWQMQDSGITAGLRGIDSVDRNVAWASGTGGTVLRTVDGGEHWTKCAVPDADKDGGTLDFRGVQAWDASTAIVMASGVGEKSRLYKTVDGCGKWTLMLKNSDPEGFYDAFTFWDRKHGFLLGDPVMNTPFWQETDENQHVLVEPRLVDRKLKHKRFLTITTSDGGANWGYWGIDRGYFTEGAAKRGAAFAASNSALFVPPQVDDPCNVQPFESNRLWIAIGGKGGARVDMGVQDPGDVCPQDAESRAALRFGWSLPRSVPIAGGTESTGIFSIAFRLNDARLSQEVRSRIGIGVAVGGDYTKPNLSRGTAAWSRDGGWAWTASSKPPHGYRSTVQWSESLKAWITAGTNGSDISRDDGRTWEALDDGNWNALSLPFVVGPNGRIGRLNAGALGKR